MLPVPQREDRQVTPLHGGVPGMSTPRWHAWQVPMALSPLPDTEKLICPVTVACAFKGKSLF